jgi:hypothetical protein
MHRATPAGQRLQRLLDALAHLVVARCFGLERDRGVAHDRRVDRGDGSGVAGRGEAHRAAGQGQAHEGGRGRAGALQFGRRDQRRGCFGARHAHKPLALEVL